MAVSYASYLKLDELLALQQPRSAGPEHDEMLFIVIHQVYELWFKEMLHELAYLEKLLRDNATPRALHTLKRILTVLKVMVAQIDVLETMTPLEFLSFRDRLESGSGFQSFQFRELEFVLGTKNPAASPRYPEGSEARRRLEARYRASTLWDAFLAYLVRNEYPVPTSRLSLDGAHWAVTDGTPEALSGSRNALAPYCRRFRVADRLLLSGHSHQAWPDVGFEAQHRAWLDAAEYVDDKWERVFAVAGRVQDGF